MKLNRKKNRVTAGTWNPNWMADPAYDDMIVFKCRGNEHKRIHDALSEYLYQGSAAGKFGSIGSGYGEVDVWLTDKTTIDDVEDLIQFMQDNGAYITDYYFKKLRERFGVVDASSRVSRRRRITASTSDMEFQRFIDEVADTATVDLGIRCKIKSKRITDTFGSVIFEFRPNWRDNRLITISAGYNFGNDFVKIPIAVFVKDSFDGHDEEEEFYTFSECADYIINTIEHRLVD